MLKRIDAAFAFQLPHYLIWSNSNFHHRNEQTPYREQVGRAIVQDYAASMA